MAITTIILVFHSSLLQIEDDTEYSVIELGANNFGEIDFLTQKITLPDYGYITNFGKRPT